MPTPVEMFGPEAVNDSLHFTQYVPTDIEHYHMVLAAVGGLSWEMMCQLRRMGAAPSDAKSLKITVTAEWSEVGVY